MAVESIAQVQSVQTDMDAHTVTVEFDDEELSIGDVVLALNEAGYTVPSYELAK